METTEADKIIVKFHWWTMNRKEQIWKWEYNVRNYIWKKLPWIYFSLKADQIIEKIVISQEFWHFLSVLYYFKNHFEDFMCIIDIKIKIKCI